jgi:hypothetical protein
MPVVIPVPPIVATAILLLLHTPEGVALVSVEVAPSQKESVPPIAATVVGMLTVTTLVAAAAPHALVMVYDIVAVPFEMPVTIPVAAPIVATAGVVLLHTPPVDAELSVSGVPVQTMLLPLIAEGVAGAAITVTTAVAGPDPTL